MTISALRLLQPHPFGIILPLLTCLCHHYLSACGSRFFRNTFKGRSSCSHTEAPSPSRCLFCPILDMNRAPQGHPSLKFAMYSLNPPFPLPLNDRCSLWPRVQTLVGPLKRVQPRKITIVRDLATLWEQQCTNRVLWHDGAFNPSIKGPCWRHCINHYP